MKAAKALVAFITTTATGLLAAGVLDGTAAVIVGSLTAGIVAAAAVYGIKNAV